MIDFSHYPIGALAADFLQALACNQPILVVAEPGAGKSTLLPLLCLQDPTLGRGRICLLEPRRVAARAVATRMAALLGEPLGLRIGLSMRGLQKVSAQTQIEVITEGVLTRRIQNDPELSGVGIVIFDEFHERHLDTDLGLALVRDVQQSLRPDLKLVIMSATLPVAPLRQVLDPLIELRASGRSHQLTQHWGCGLGQSFDANAVARLCLRAYREQPGDILVFVPGRREIRQLQTRLADLDAQCLALHGDLSIQAQSAALAQGPQRRILLATDIAQTALTIEGISAVVDSGWARTNQWHPRRAMTELVTQKASQSTATQRAGRAGRTGAGHVYRVCREQEFAHLPVQATAAILREDLSEFVLTLANWGVQDPRQLTLIDQPPATSLAAATDLLQRLGFLDEGRLTPLGRAAQKLPLSPRLAAMYLRCVALGAGRRAAALTAIMDSVRRLPDALGEAADQLSQGRGDRLAVRLYRRLCSGLAQSDTYHVADGLLFCFAFPERVARRRDDDPRRYQFINGVGGQLSETDALVGQPWIVALEVDGAGSEARIFRALPVEEAPLLEAFAKDIKVVEQVLWDAQKLRPRALSRRELGALVLSTQSLFLSPELRAQGWLQGLLNEGIDLLPWSERAHTLCARVALLRQQAKHARFGFDPEPQALIDHAEDWLSMHLASLTQINDLDLYQALLEQLTWPQRQLLDQLLPEKITLASGNTHRIDYRRDGPPVLAVKLQELFGCAQVPTLAAGVALQLHLLSPARRPLAITQDLAYFWQHIYPDIRRENRGRYAKHPWPEDPLNALPTAKTSAALAGRKPKSRR